MTISIGIGEYRIGGPEERSWVMHGLGSCIGVVIADPSTHISAAAHILLPTRVGHGPDMPARYGDEAVPFLVERMREMGAGNHGLIAVMAGGARMFQMEHLIDVGSRNAEVVREALAKGRISLVAEDVGGSRGRTLWWEPATGLAYISQVGGERHELTPPQHRFVRNGARR